MTLSARAPQFSAARGFSLIELIAVIVIMGVISFMAVPRFANSDAAAVQSARDQAFSAFFSAQQLAMSRSSADNPIELVVSANSVDLREAGSSSKLPGGDYPFTFPSNVTVTSGTGSYSYDKLGRTTPGQVTFSRGSVSATIIVEASGYVHYP